MSNEFPATPELDALALRLTAFFSFQAIVEAGLGGYSPTFIPRDRNPGVRLGRALLADAFDAAMIAARCPSRAWRGSK